MSGTLKYYKMLCLNCSTEFNTHKKINDNDDKYYFFSIVPCIKCGFALDWLDIITEGTIDNVKFQDINEWYIT